MSNDTDLLTRATEAMAVLNRRGMRPHAPTSAVPSNGLQIVGATAILNCRGEGSLAFTNAPQDSTSAAWCELQGIGPYKPPIVPYPVHPMHAVLIVLDTNTLLDTLQHALLLRYPPTHLLYMVHRAQLGQPAQATEDAEDGDDAWVWHGSLAELADAARDTTVTALYIPPLPTFADQRSFAALEWVVMRLLGPDGCPWDRKQTFQSLRAGLLEEVYEVLEALDSNDMAALSEELGDLLLQVLVHGEMARQAGHFELGDVLEQVTSKLIRRHPHVFGDLVVQDSEEVLTNWEAIKSRELREKGRERSSVLDGVPRGLPALAEAQKYIKKATRTGFNWRTLDEVWAKVHEEVGELAQACEQSGDAGSTEDTAHVADEMGDVLFTLVTLASWLKVDAESALREANRKFYARFTTMERLAYTHGHRLSEMSTEELLALWAEAKRMHSGY